MYLTCHTHHFSSWQGTGASQSFPEVLGGTPHHGRPGVEQLTPLLEGHGPPLTKHPPQTPSNVYLQLMERNFLILQTIGSSSTQSENKIA